MSKYFIKTNEEVPDFYELSLKKVNISGNIIGKFGNFTIEQTFINNKTKPLEVNYTFPITETAVVTGFTVKVGEKVIFFEIDSVLPAKEKWTSGIKQKYLHYVSVHEYHLHFHEKQFCLRYSIYSHKLVIHLQDILYHK